MDRENSLLFSISVLACGAFLSLLPFVSTKELKRDVTCYSDVLHIGCGKLSFVAIHEAFFSSDHHENITCQMHSPEDEYIDDDMVTQSSNHTTCHEDIRLFVNRKCSGLKNCNFSYNQESERLCFNPEGVFVVRYKCVRDTNVNKYCNSKLSSREGYIASPGFPQYYPELKECSWSLTAEEGQTILLKVLHLHLRTATEVTPTPSDPDLLFVIGHHSDHPTRCDDDSLTVVEGMTKRFSVCGEELDDLKSHEADASEGLELRFKSSAFLPASGFLVYYKIEGCPTLPPVEGTHLLERNGSAAVYACRGDQVFNDTMENRRFLRCIRDHHWNDTLPLCVSLEEIFPTSMASPNATFEENDEDDTVGVATKIWRNIKFPSDAGLIEDILLPCILIGVLIIGNIIIVIIIFVIRRRQNKNIEEEDGNLDEADPQPLVTEADV